MVTNVLNKTDLSTRLQFFFIVKRFFKGWDSIKYRYIMIVSYSLYNFCIILNL